MGLNEHQLRWQATTLDLLLELAGTYKRGPWIPAGEVVAAVQLSTSASPQAASGALRALRKVGLADSCETSEGSFWKATEAAERMRDLVFPDLIWATDMAERFEDAIERITGAFDNDTLNDQGKINRARLAIVALAQAEVEDRSPSSESGRSVGGEGR